MSRAFRMPGLAGVAFVVLSSAVVPLSGQTELYRSDAFVVSDTSVQQGSFTAVAASRDTILSTYPRSGREMRFRFSINGQDNEFRPGTEHTIYIRPRDGRILTPIYVFGEEQPPRLPTPEESGSGEEGVAQVTIRLDLRHVLRSFREQGFYDPPRGPRIHGEDFQAVYAIGDTDPLSWDPDVLRPGSPAQLADSDGDGIFTATIPVEAQYTRPVTADGRAIWARRADISGFPQLHTSQRLLDALYRMSLEELQQLVREDGALSAGAKWPGVWTRDIAYSAVLALAIAAPDAVRRSLLAKVDSAGRIIQDTGTGGSWPISTDRMTWALAAWELYAVTGDSEWLRSAYDIISRSAEADLHAIFDPLTSLVTGETSFMDWREQSYPRWMDPRDIAQSAGISTNAVHYATYRILADMAQALGEPWERWNGIAAALQRAINAELWQVDSGWYATFRYGRIFQSLSPRSDGLGGALAVIYGVATPEQRRRIAARTPVVAFGMPVFWPYIPNTPAYHNAAIWPFVTAYWMWAAAEAGNGAGVEHALAAVYRPGALFLTNKENMVASTGHFEGTALNSDRQLWSVAGSLATEYRVLFGMRLGPKRLIFRPMIPPAYTGGRTLSNLRYRNATLTVSIHGFGDSVASVRLDDRAVQLAEITGTMTGRHTLEIEMNGRWPEGGVNLVENRFTPETPQVALRADTLVWTPVAGAASYTIYRNGRRFSSGPLTSAYVGGDDGLAEYQVLAADSLGMESFLSEPVQVGRAGSVMIIQPAGPRLESEHAGFSGAGYVRLTRDRNTTVAIPVRITVGGTYSIDARYANGSGPVNTDSKAAVRTLLVDGVQAGVLILPQRGAGAWSDWGYSTRQRVSLAPGMHTLTVIYTALDENMDRRVNTALLDHVRLTRLSANPAN